MRPMEWSALLANQSAPSGPGVMPRGWGNELPKWVAVPPVVMRPTELELTNHRAPSGPDVIAVGNEMLLLAYWVVLPLVSMRQTACVSWLYPPLLVNQRLPSGPAVI